MQDLKNYPMSTEYYILRQEIREKYLFAKAVILLKICLAGAAMGLAFAAIFFFSAYGIEVCGFDYNGNNDPFCLNQIKAVRHG